MPLINFKKLGYSGPTDFPKTGLLNTLYLLDTTGIVNTPASETTLNGGIFLSGETLLPAAGQSSTVYGTAYYNPTLRRDVTITFPTQVKNVVFDLYNGWQPRLHTKY